MTRKEFPGGWYADALPSGEYAVIYHDARGYMDTHRGRVGFSPDGRRPLFPRITNIHGFKVAGQFGVNDTPEWIDGRGWVTHLVTPWGTSPLIYDANGFLRFATKADGSQGLRYVERGTGRIVSGDDTYQPRPNKRFPSPRVPLHEWTDLGDGLFIGQGPGGVVLWDSSTSRLVAAGVCRFIRVHREDDRISIAYWDEGLKKGQGKAVCLWMTVAELKASPVIAATPAPAPQPQPDDDGDDDNMNTAQYTDLRDRLKAIDTKLAQVLDALDEIPPPPPDDDDIPAPAPEQPSIPLESVTWLNSGNPLGFRVASQIADVTITKKADDGSTPYSGDNFSVCFPHTKAGEWPALTNAEGVKYEGNVCVFARINSRWYGAAAEWLKVNQTCKRLSNRPERDSWGIGPHTKKEPMRSWGPKSGEWIGIMVCTPVRDGIEGPSQERSNIFLVRWP